MGYDDNIGRLNQPHRPTDVIRPKKAPDIAPGTMIDRPVLYVDLDGVAWWIDPNKRVCERVL
jgi:hypothetical protein